MVRKLVQNMVNVTRSEHVLQTGGGVIDRTRPELKNSEVCCFNSCNGHDADRPMGPMGPVLPRVAREKHSEASIIF